jgi:sugar O-acyltransferase (sialic acid O-acetyltransferase NeuD family)
MDIIVVGGFIEVIELCENCGLNILGIIDKSPESDINGYPVLGSDKDVIKILKKYPLSKLVITPDSPFLREKLVRYYSDFGFSFQSVVSPKAEISKSAKIGNGVIIQSGVNVSSKVVIKDFVKLNTNSNIMHESTLENYVTVAPNAVILGRIKVGEFSYIGASSTILPNLTIEDKVIVGAGAVVVKSVGKGRTVIGIPAK